MHEEIEAASTFLAGLAGARLPPDQAERFKASLRERMLAKFYAHWNVHQPILGNGYRAITNSGRLMDPLLVQAAAAAGVPEALSAMPSELVVWVDPSDVSYRIGDQGSICTLYHNGYRPRVSASPSKGSPVYISVN